MTDPNLYFIAMGMGLIAWSLTAGADFGAGVWSLLARGPRRNAQREAVERAIAPIWEANHVWLIFVLVLMFTVFPRAFSAIGTALHIPLTAALVGIVLRGAAFTFHAYDVQARDQVWSRVFAASSLFTPVALGVSLGALATGDIRVEGRNVVSGFFAGWTSLFAVLVGLLALSLFMMLAATYLAQESTDRVRDDFRARALAMEIVAGILAAVTLVAARDDAPAAFARLLGSTWTAALHSLTAVLALSTLALLWTRRFGAARFTAAAQVTCVVLGFGLALDGHLVVPDVEVHTAGARPEVLAALPGPLIAGTLLLAPSLYFLFRIFKARSD